MTHEMQDPVGAEGVVWAVAARTGLVPIDDVLAELPAGVRQWYTEWFAVTFDWCGHTGEDIGLIRPFGSRRATCPRCAVLGDVEAYLERCGRCGVLVGRDGFGGTIARGHLVLVPMSLCRSCWIEGGGS
jgi:hypothetical protein